jgi:uncharacterized protein YjiS (DUF1127 family)
MQQIVMVTILGLTAPIVKPMYGRYADEELGVMVAERIEGRAPGAAAGSGGTVWGLVGAIVMVAIATLLAWGERRRQRRALRELSPELLRDIGIGPADVYREVEKPFWRA